MVSIDLSHGNRPGPSAVRGESIEATAILGPGLDRTCANREWHGVWRHRHDRLGAQKRRGGGGSIGILLPRPCLGANGDIVGARVKDLLEKAPDSRPIPYTGQGLYHWSDLRPRGVRQARYTDSFQERVQCSSRVLGESVILGVEHYWNVATTV